MSFAGPKRLRFLTLLGIFLTLHINLHTQSEIRYALVIGNNEYSGISNLKNPVNDASDMTAALRRLGFSVEMLTNADQIQMEQAVVRLGQKLSSSKDAIGLFFFAGHGVQSGGENFLIPSNTLVSSEAFLRSRAIASQAVLDTLAAAGNSVNVIILDACRDNPFGWNRSGHRGLAVIGVQPPGSMVVYATSAGSTAEDGNGRNGVFTQELLKHLETPGLDISEVFRLTGASVRQTTNGRQIPAVYNQFFDRASFTGANSADTSLRFGSITVSTGNIHIRVVSAATVSLLGQSMQVPAGGTLPVQGVAAGAVQISVRYADGTSESKTVTVQSNQTVSAVFVYQAQSTEGLIPMIRVEGGSFRLGGSLSTTVTSFFMGRTEITQGQWRAVMGNNPSDTSKGIGDNYPVNGVSWYDAIVFCNRLSQMEGLSPVYSIKNTTDTSRWGVVPLKREVAWDTVIVNWSANGYRLPTEAEWEYAARGGIRSHGNAYAGGNDLDSVAWTEMNSDFHNQPVATKPANELGLHDMSGSVWEWTWNWYSDTLWGSSDPRGPSSGTYRVKRGGSWDADLTYLELSYRGDSIPSDRFRGTGLRVVHP